MHRKDDLESILMKVYQLIYLYFFSELDEQEKVERLRGSDKRPLFDAQMNLRHLALANHSFYNAYNNTEFMKSLIKRIVDHYGIFIDQNQDIIFAGFPENNLHLLRVYISLLTHFDPRKTFFYSDDFLIYIYNHIQRLTNDLSTRNPVLDFLQVVAGITIHPVTETTKILLLNSSLMGCKNSLILLTSIDPFVEPSEPIYFLNKQRLEKLYSPDNVEHYYENLKQALTVLNVKLRPIAQFLSIRTSFLRLYRLGYSWLTAFALNYKATQRILNLLKQEIIPITEKKLFILLESSQPEVFLEHFVNENRHGNISSRLLKIFTSAPGRALYEKSLTKKLRDMTTTIAQDKRNKKNYDPIQLIKMYQKFPQILDKMTLAHLLDYSNIIAILSHPTVDLSRWQPDKLYNCLINSKQSVSAAQLDAIMKLPYMLTYYNSSKKIVEFLQSDEYRILAMAKNGNLLFSLIGAEIFRINKPFTSDYTEALNFANITTPDASLLALLSELSEQLLRWLIHHYGNCLEEIYTVVNTNTALHKIVCAFNQEVLLKYIGDVDFLLSLDKLMLESGKSVLDHLLHSSDLTTLSHYFTTKLELLNGYNSGLLKRLIDNPNLFIFRKTDLLLFSREQLSYGRQVLSDLMYLDVKILQWIAPLRGKTIVTMSRTGVFDVLSTYWRYLPLEDTTGDDDEFFMWLTKLHAEKFDSESSFLEFFLTGEMKHVLVPFFTFLRNKSKNKEILFDKIFLKTVATSDPSHPIFLSYSPEYWYQLFEQYDEKYAVNFLSYLASPCNTLFWNVLIEKYFLVEAMAKNKTDIIDFIENHPAKKQALNCYNIPDLPKDEPQERPSRSYWSPQPSKNHLAEDKTLTPTKKVKLEHHKTTVRYDSNHRYADLVQQFTLLKEQSGNISAKEQATKLRQIKQQLDQKILQLSDSVEPQSSQMSYTLT